MKSDPALASLSPRPRPPEPRGTGTQRARGWSQQVPKPAPTPSLGRPPLPRGGSGEAADGAQGPLQGLSQGLTVGQAGQLLKD